MRKFQVALTLITTTVALASPLAAQGRGRGNDGIPPGHRPPAGLCRVWIDGVPPGRQPAPTDCGRAVANRPRNSRVIYGDRYDRNGSSKYKGSKKNDRRWTRINGRLCEVKNGKDGRVTYRCEGDRRDRDRNPYWDRNSRRSDDNRSSGVWRDTRSNRDGELRRPSKNNDITKIYGRRN